MPEREHLLVKDFPVQFDCERIDRRICNASACCPATIFQSGIPSDESYKPFSSSFKIVCNKTLAPFAMSAAVVNSLGE